MRFIKTLLLCLSLAFSLPVAADVQEGRDYSVINPPVSTDSPGKIEVSEFFWYGCPHCFHFEPALKQWAKTQPKDVVLRLVSAPLNVNVWTPGAKLYYALDALGVEDRLRNDIFAAIHTDRQLSPTDERAFPAWVAKKGVDAAKFSEVYASFTVQSKVQRAMQLGQAYRVDGTPSVIVNGRYRILEPGAMSPERFAEVATALVAKARKDSGK
ncbi:MAG: thiol:disulfide interchange protein DsbA/DsbL [Rhodocyclaceae bacterium]|nr:thiol:disulfide interchange protein DsbA/DsbL [Rhodocyclaceae bacterium]